MSAYAGYETLRVEVARGVAFVALDPFPINLLDLALDLSEDS